MQIHAFMFVLFGFLSIRKLKILNKNKLWVEVH
jgi:cell shape-determining protein MreD